MKLVLCQITMSTNLSFSILKFIPVLLCFIFHNTNMYCLNDSIKTKKTVVFDSSKIEVRKLSEEKQKEIFNDSDYKYDKISSAPRTPWEEFKEWVARMVSKLFNTEEGQTGWKIFQYVLIATVIVTVVLLLLKNNVRALFYGKSASVKLDFSEIEEDIDKIDFTKMITEAISKKDYRKAIRLHFLMLLKQLSDKKLIQWKIDKTNNDYLIELSNNKFSRQFKELSILYEYFWYGNFPLDENKFKQTVEKFNSINV